MCLGLAFYLDRNSALVGGDDLISGADKATRVVEMPSQAVIGAMIMLLGAATCALAFARLRRHLFLTTYRMAAVAGGVWIGTALLLSVLVTCVVGGAARDRDRGDVRAAAAVAADDGGPPEPRHAPTVTLRRGKIDGWPDRAAWAAFVVVTAIVGGAAPAAGASLYDHFTLSGPRYQNQRSYIERSIASTRYGFNLDGVKLTNADAYRRNGVTRRRSRRRRRRSRRCGSCPSTPSSRPASGSRAATSSTTAATRTSIATPSAATAGRCS